MTAGHYFSVILQKLEYPKVKGQLVIFGATNWDLIGRKEVPKQSGIIKLSSVCCFCILPIGYIQLCLLGDINTFLISKIHG